MPKFLDAPSWYDSDGTLRTLSGTVRFRSGAGNVYLPYTDFTSGGASSSYYVLTTAGTNGNIAYSNGSYPVWLSNGTSGQVLTSNGNATPSWKNLSLYLHKIHISESDTIDVVANVYSMSSTSLTNNTIRGLITFLTQKKCNAINNCLAAAGIVQASGTIYDAVAGIISRSSSYVNFVTYSTTGAATVESASLHSTTASSSATVTETIVSIS